MKIRKIIALTLSHAAVGAIGFVAGIYLLPVLIAPEPPAGTLLESLETAAAYTATFTRDLPGSDALHWGEGTVAIGPGHVSLRGRLAPGPDYKLYLAPRFVDTAAEFLGVKERSVRVGDVRSFDGFVVTVPSGIDIEQYDTVVVWCETFGKFISAAQYRQ